jgi:hypothetical protein
VRGAGRVEIGPLTLLPFWEGEGEVVVVVTEVEAKRREEAGRNTAVETYGKV